MVWMAAWLFLAQAFWQAMLPGEWNDLELAQFMANSPWAQMAVPSSKDSSVSGVPAYLATADLVQKAFAERARRAGLRAHLDPKAPAEPLQEEFAAWFAENQTGHIIVAVRVGNNKAFLSESETRHLEQNCTMDLARVKTKSSSYFPPTNSNPNLYIAFPRPQGEPADGNLTFSLYLPGVSLPARTLQFKIKDLLVDGKTEM
jgi:hypothetical protein